MRPYAGGAPVVEVVRSAFVESWHRGSVAILGPDGTPLASIGDPAGAIFPRSSNKVMQATAMLRSGLRPASTEHLALAAASHSGEPFHVDGARAILAGAGLTEADLLCPPDLPLSPAARADVLRAGGGPARIYMNCSGKHASMLATCVAAGWTTEDYVAPDHPLQKACRTAVEELASQNVPVIGVDGCGAPVMALSLTGLARAFLRAVSADEGTPERRVADAMRAHPEYMSGSDRDDLRLMRAVPGLLSKGGAEGVLAVALPGRGAVAVKIDDGAARATLPVLLAALTQLGVEADLAPDPVLGGGSPVGTVRAIRWP